MTFNEIAAGGWFQVNSKIYLKLKESIFDWTEDEFNCVDILSGELKFFPEAESVILIESRCRE